MRIILVLCCVLMGCSADSRPQPGERISPLELVGVLDDEQALNRPHDVELQGNVAYVPGKGGSLALIDISDPANPELLSALMDAVGLEDAETVLPMGDVLLLGARDFLSVDVRDPAHPKILKRISDRPRIDKINGMALSGRHVFTANKTGFVTVFDVSDPADPKYVDALDTTARGGLEKPHDIAVSGDRIIVVDAALTSPANVRMYRVREAGTGRLLPSRDWEIEGAIPTSEQLRFDLGGANRVAVAGRHAYVGAFGRDRVGVIDIGDPRSLVQVANMPCCDIDATGMTVSGQVLFVSGGECVEAIDISEPSRPVSLAQYRAGELFPTRRIEFGGATRYDNGHDLVYRDGYLYVTAQNDHRFGVLKVNDPRLLRLAEPPAAE